jgi:hypothetical protein
MCVYTPTGLSIGTTHHGSKHEVLGASSIGTIFGDTWALRAGSDFLRTPLGRSSQNAGKAK